MPRIAEPLARFCAEHNKADNNNKRGTERELYAAVTHIAMYHATKSVSQKDQKRAK